MINTVLGSIHAEELGITSAHEHIFIDMRKCVDITGNESANFYDTLTAENRAEVWKDPYALLDNARLSKKEDAISEVELFKKWGGNTIVDCTLDEIGRDPLALRDVSLKTGVNIVLGCGHYYNKAQFSYVEKASVDTLADEMYQDITVGINGTDIKAGLIGEIGTSAIITESEKKVLTAAGVVGAQTGKAVHVHTDLYTENGFSIVNTLTNCGMSPEKICIDHIDVVLRLDYIRDLLKLGVFVEFDNFGKEFYISKNKRFAYDLERIKVIKILIDEGYANQILISNDICLKSMWTKYGGLGYAHILRTVKDMAIEHGISEETYNSILTENVKSFLE